MNGIPSIRTGHVGLNVTDIERSKEFFRRVLDIDVLRVSSDRERRFVYLGTGGAILLTLWQQSDGRFDPRRPGLHHLAFEVSDAEAVRRAATELSAIGATIFNDGIVAHSEGSESGAIFFEDPDGTRIEIYSADAGTGSPAPHSGGPACGFF